MLRVKIKVNLKQSNPFLNVGSKNRFKVSALLTNMADERPVSCVILWWGAPNKYG
jgi:hypothetical protein